jgi:hypothetical protein
MTDVYLEIGKQRVFACTFDWPGWCRAGKTEESALEALATYAERYAEVAREAGVRFPTSATEFRVVDRVPGSATTDFGAPGAIPDQDSEPLKPAEAKRLVSLVQAAWTVFDRIVAGAPEALRKGPRGGGRDRDKIVEHVLGAEAGYTRGLGLRQRQPDARDTGALTANRAELLDTLRSPAEGVRWPARYAARRIAWHVLDHAWEIQDRA